MEGFWLLLGHLIGDYVVQNDWMAKNKVNPHPSTLNVCDASKVEFWEEAEQKWSLGHFACTVHCLFYTLAVWACTFWWMPWWGLLACFLVHWPVDRFRLARRWMCNVSGQKQFAEGPLSPWSVIIVDNIFHLLTLGVIASVAGR